MSDNVELEIRAKNLTQDAFNAVAASMKSTADGAAQTASQSAASFAGLSSAVKGHLGEMGASLQTAFESPLAGVQQLAGSIGGTLKDALSSIGPEAAIAAGAIGGLIAVTTGIVAVTIGLADHAAHAGEEVLAFSQKTGIAIENVGQLQFAVTAAGGSLDSISGILQHLTLKEATDQGGKFSAALKDIGINANTFAKMDNESRILALAQGFQQGAKSGNEMKDAIALMGRSGAESLPILMKLTPALMQMGAQLGVHWSKDSIAASEQFSVGMRAIEGAIGGVANRIGIALLPAMSELVSKLATSPGFMDGVTNATITLAHGLGYAVEGFGYVVAGLIDMGDEMTKSGMLALGLAINVEKMAQSILKAMSYLPGATAEATAGFAILDGKIRDQQSELASLTKTHGTLATASKTVIDTTQTLGKSLTGLTAASMKQIEANLALNKTHNDAGAAALKYEQAVQAIVDALEGDSKKTKETSDAISRVIALNQDDIDVKTRVVAAIEKLIQGHVKLTAAEQAYFEANRSLTKESAAGLQELEKLQNEYYQIVQKGEGGNLAVKLAAIQKEFDTAKATLDKRKGLDANYDAELDQLRKNRTAKEDAARFDQQQKDQKFADETEKIWGDYYATIEKADGDTIEAELAHIDTWYTHEVATLDQLLNSGSISWTQYFSRLIALQNDATAKQVQAVDTYADKVKRSQQEIASLWDQYDAIILARSGNTTDAQVRNVQRWRDDQLSKLKQSDADYQAHYDAIVALAEAKTQDIIHANDPLWAAWKGLNVDMRSSMASTWEQVLSGAKSWKDAMLQPFNDFRDGLKKILAAILADWEQQLFNPLLKLAHNAMGMLMNMLTGGGGGGLNLAGLFGAGAQAGGASLLGGLLGGGGGAAGAGLGINVTAAGTAIPGAATAGGSGGLLGGLGLGLGTVAAGAGAAGAGFGTGYLLSNAFGKTAGTIGGGLSGAAEGALIGSIVPGIGTAIGALIGGLSGVIGGLFGGGNKDHKEVTGWVNQNFGNFDAFHDKLNAMSAELKKVGVDSEQLWINLSQGKKPATQAIQDVVDAFQKVQKAQQDAATAADDATQQQVTDATKVQTAIQAQIDLLDTEATTIQASGDASTEAGQAKLAAIAAERKALQAKLDEAEKAVADTMAKIDLDATSTSAAIQQAFTQPIHIKYQYDPTNAPPRAPSGDGGYGGYGSYGDGGDLPGHADGAYIREDHLARVHAGEIIGPMDFMTQALAGALAANGGSTGATDQRIVINLDGQRMADVLVRRIPNSVQRFTNARS